MTNLSVAGEIARFVLNSTFRNAAFFILSVVLTVLVRHSRLRALLVDKIQQRPRQAVAWATVLGALSPLCSCSVIPLVSGLLVLGVPLAPTWRSGSRRRSRIRRRSS